MRSGFESVVEQVGGEFNTKEGGVLGIIMWSWG